jgi:hypothetical protein
MGRERTVARGLQADCSSEDELSENRPFRRKQRAVAVRMLVAAVGCAGAVGGALVLTAPGSPDGLADRLRWLATAWLCLGVWLGAAIGAVARLRFFSPEDIAGSSSGLGSPAVRTAKANLQNTLEQVVLAAFAYAGVCLSLGRPDATLVALVALFSMGACYSGRACPTVHFAGR